MVVVFPVTPLRSSTCADAWVIFSSVRSGVISDSEPMKVVLPTAKCPTTRIFAALVTALET